MFVLTNLAKNSNIKLLVTEWTTRKPLSSATQTALNSLHCQRMQAWSRLMKMLETLLTP